MKKILALVLFSALLLAGCGTPTKDPNPQPQNPAQGQEQPGGEQEKTPLAELTDYMTENVFGPDVKDERIALEKEVNQFFFRYAKQYDYRFLPTIADGIFADFNAALLYAYHQRQDPVDPTMSVEFVDSILQRDFPDIAYENATTESFTLKDGVYTPEAFSFDGSTGFAITELVRETKDNTPLYTAHLLGYPFDELDYTEGDKIENYSQNAQYVYTRMQEDAYKDLNFSQALEKVFADGDAIALPKSNIDITMQFTVSLEETTKEYVLHYQQISITRTHE